MSARRSPSRCPAPLEQNSNNLPNVQAPIVDQLEIHQPRRSVARVTGRCDIRNMGITYFSFASSSATGALALIWAAGDNIRRGCRSTGLALIGIACLLLVAAGVAGYALVSGNDPEQWFPLLAKCSALGHC